MSRRQPPPVLDEDYQRLLAFRSELREFLRWSEQAADEAGLTPALHQLLLVVRGHPTSRARRSAQPPRRCTYATTAPSSSPSAPRPPG